MGRSKARKYKSQRDRRRREKREQAERQATRQANGETPQKLGFLARVWSSLWACFRWVWKIVVAVAVVVQYVSYAQSRLAVVPRDALDPSAPFSVPFIIENRGYLPFYGLAFKCFVRDLQGKAGQSIGNLSFVKDEGGRVGDLPAEGQTTISCDFVFAQNSPIRSADIDVAVRYRPIFFPWPVEKTFRFTTAETANGNLIWLPHISPPEENEK